MIASRLAVKTLLTTSVNHVNNFATSLISGTGRELGDIKADWLCLEARFYPILPELLLLSAAIRTRA